MLSHLPSPLAWTVTVVLAVLWLLPLLDTVRHRRRLENAKLEREVWALELANAKNALELRRQYLGEPEPDVDAAVIAQLIASGDAYKILGRKIEEEPTKEPSFWSIESKYSWLPLRASDVFLRYCVGTLFCTMLVGLGGVTASALFSFEFPKLVGVVFDALASGEIWAILGAAVALTLAKLVHWISGANFAGEWFETDPQSSSTPDA